MQDILPEPVLDALREHYYAGVTAAEIGYVHNAADEDSVTGALGQSLLTPGIRIIELNGQSYRWRANHYKIGGRGKGAPEKRFGADGIFQLEVFDQAGKVLRRKGLLFQAKKEWKGTDRKLVEQVRLMEEYSPSAIVVDYRRAGFTAVAGQRVIQADGNRRAIPSQDSVRLAEILGDEFVRCRRGDVGTFWNPDTRVLENEAGVIAARPLIPQHVITTAVQRVR